MKSILKKDDIFILNEAKNKKEILKNIVSLAYDKKYISNKEKVLESFLKREKEGETGMGDFIAIPHAIDESIVKTSVFIILLKNHVKWKSIDKKNKAKFIFALLVPKLNQKTDHLKVLSGIAEKLMDQKNRETLESYDINKIFDIFK